MSIDSARKWMKTAAAITALHLLGIVNLDNLDFFGLSLSDDGKSRFTVIFMLNIWGLFACFKMLIHLRQQTFFTQDAPFYTREICLTLARLICGKEGKATALSPKKYYDRTGAVISTEKAKRIVTVMDLTMIDWDFSTSDGDPGFVKIYASRAIKDGASECTEPRDVPTKLYVKSRKIAIARSWLYNPYLIDNAISTFLSCLLFWIIAPLWQICS